MSTLLAENLIICVRGGQHYFYLPQLLCDYQINLIFRTLATFFDDVFRIRSHFLCLTVDAAFYNSSWFRIFLFLNLFRPVDLSEPTIIFHLTSVNDF
jgi:hypothetical protein